MKRSLLIGLVLPIILLTEMFADTMDRESAVSRVKKYFNYSQAPEPIEEKEQVVFSEDLITEEILSSEEMESLEIVEPIKMAKFERSEMAYPQSGIVQRIVKPLESASRGNLAQIEANAKRAIDQEIQKVEEAKEKALKKINEVVRDVEDAK